MNRESTSFTIIQARKLIWVQLRGEWSVSHDLAYLTQLSAAMGAMRKRPWAMVVDMRYWRVSDIKSAFVSPDISNIELDRRNQVLEAWWVNEDTQADFLVPFIRRQRSIDFVRSRHAKDIENALRAHRFKPAIPTEWSHYTGALCPLRE